MLTPRQRILSTLAFEEPDCVPYHVMFEEADARLSLPFFENPALFSQFSNHLPFINIESKRYELSPDRYTDEFGCVWNLKNNVPHLVDYPLKSATLKGYEFPEFNMSEYLIGVENFLNSYPEHFILCGMAQGFFDRGWSLRGLENFLVDWIENPGFVKQLFEVLTAHYLNILDCISVYPFDGIRFADDWGAQRGMLMGPKRWREFIKPCLKKIFGKARELGLLVMVHSDGDVMEIIPDLIDIGVQILNPVQPEAMNILEIKRAYGRELCLNGGVSSQYTLPWGSPMEVKGEVCACLHYLAQGGGYVIGPAKSILVDTPPQNIAALLETILEQPVKPLSKTEPLPKHVAELDRVYMAFHSQETTDHAHTNHFGQTCNMAGTMAPMSSLSNAVSREMSQHKEHCT